MNDTRFCCSCERLKPEYEVPSVTIFSPESGDWRISFIPDNEHSLRSANLDIQVFDNLTGEIHKHSLFTTVDELVPLMQALKKFVDRDPQYYAK